MSHDGNPSAAVFCRLYLQEQRAWQRAAGLKLPRLYTMHSRMGSKTWYEVRGGDPERVLWSGTSCCAYQARAQAIARELRKIELRTEVDGGEATNGR